jgi:DNA-binding CsgD family transcriptional regulator
MVDAAMAGAAGFVLKQIRDNELISSIRVFDLIGAGLTNRQIGEELHLAEKTVENYVSNLLAKLGMARRSEAAAFAARVDERRRLRDS